VPISRVNLARGRGGCRPLRQIVVLRDVALTVGAGEAGWRCSDPTAPADDAPARGLGPATAHRPRWHFAGRDMAAPARATR